MYVCMHACMHACMYVCMYTYSYKCTYIHVHIYIYVYIYIYIYIYTRNIRAFPLAPGNATQAQLRTEGQYHREGILEGNVDKMS